MDEDKRDPAAQIVGREHELAVLQGFLEVPRSPGVLVLTGGPGIGKTTLWQAGVDAARTRGLRVLVARPSGAEARLSFGALTDLLEGVDVAELEGLPAPQRRALQVALLRSEPMGAPVEPHAISLGFLNGLRALAADAPLLIAIDDVQWLDLPSAEALAFVARRLAGNEVGFLLTRRLGSSSTLERAVERSGLERLEVGPLSLGATRRLLSGRLGLILPRHVLRRLFESAAGNPLFALELGRALAQRGAPELGEELPVPDVIEDLLGTRVERLPREVRRLLLAVALSADPHTSQLEAIGDPGDLDDAVDLGVLLIDRNRVRASHPLLAAAAKQHSTARERRELHVELARVVADEELRVRHLALATEEPDVELAAAAAAAAAGAAARGAARDAVELAEHALRVTPGEDDLRSDRVLALGGYLETAGERQRVTDLLTPELDSLPHGGPRVRALLLLSEGGTIERYGDHGRYFERALRESRGDPSLRAYVLANKALNVAAEGVERVREAEAWALEALVEAPGAGLEVERLALRGLGWARSLRGRPIEDVCERFRASSDVASCITDSPEPVAGLRLMWRGRMDEARATLTPFLLAADERGEAVAYAWLRLNMCELGLRVGEWAEVSRLLDEWAESADQRLLITPTYQRCRALLAAGRGLPDEAERWARPALADSEAMGYRWQILESRRALGVAALLAHEPAQAGEHLRSVWLYTAREGVDEPGAFPVAPDLVEALAELGELGEASAVTDRLRDLAVQQRHPWGLATAKRCTALVRLASAKYDEQAGSLLVQAAGGYARLGLRYDRARSLLSLGRAQRRLKKWGAARRSLEQAVAAFDEIDSPGWAEQARSELSRVGARRPQPSGELTPAERRVVALAAEGLSNKEIARTLFVTVHTIEVHLSHAYAKLGVRSRAQLAGRLAQR